MSILERYVIRDDTGVGRNKLKTLTVCGARKGPPNWPGVWGPPRVPPARAPEMARSATDQFSEKKFILEITPISMKILLIC